MRRVFYLMSGQAHLPYLTVSLHTLRRHWNGVVDVYAWPESFDIAARVCKAFGATCILVEPPYKGKNAQFVGKIQIARSFPADDSNLYLDADTTVHGDLSPLFEMVEIVGFVATQFSGWLTNTRGIISRMEDLKRFRFQLASIEALQRHPFPSVNGGVWASISSSLVLKKWVEYTVEALSTFIPDEKVLHLLQVEFPPAEYLVACFNGKYNCSPKFQHPSLRDEDVVIYHYHGDCNVRPEGEGRKWAKSQKGYDLWWPLYQHCLENNLGGIRDWQPTVRNRYIDYLKQEPVK